LKGYASFSVAGTFGGNLYFDLEGFSGSMLVYRGFERLCKKIHAVSVSVPALFPCLIMVVY